MKLLILAVPSGGGHVQAAKALVEAGRRFPHCQVKYLNALDYASRPARLAWQKAYLTLVNHSPALWGFIFNKSDNQTAKKLLDLTSQLQELTAKPLISFIKKSFAVNSHKSLVISYFYGGSVTSANAESFLKNKEIEGALVGGASLKQEEIKKILQIAKKY